MNPFWVKKKKKSPINVKTSTGQNKTKKNETFY